MMTILVIVFLFVFFLCCNKGVVIFLFIFHSLPKDDDEPRVRCHLLLLFSLVIKDDDEPGGLSPSYCVFFPVGANNDEKLGPHHCLFLFSLATEDNDEPSISRHFLVFSPLTANDYDNQPRQRALYLSSFDILFINSRRQQ
jgi:hypothetical protein